MLVIVCLGLGLGRGWEITNNGYEVSFKGDKNIQSLYCGGSSITVNMLNH